jgi:hypothetical protein
MAVDQTVFVKRHIAIVSPVETYDLGGTYATLALTQNSALLAVSAHSQDNGGQERAGEFSAYCHYPRREICPHDWSARAR